MTGPFSVLRGQYRVAAIGRSLFLPDIDWLDVRETAVLQAFLEFSSAGSLFFSKITLILAK
jgi:hypothetical protein